MINDKIQQAMMAMQLLQMLRQPQQQQQEASAQQQALMQRQRQFQQEQMMNQQQIEQRNQLAALSALSDVSRDPMTGSVDPTMVLDYLRQKMGVNIQRPQPQANPMAQYFQSQQGGQR